MKKNIKIVIATIGLISVFIVSYIILIVKGIFPNPFLDIKDLICTRSYDLGDVVRTEMVTIKFDKHQIIKEIQEQNLYKYKEESKAIEYYNEMSKYSSKVSLENNTVTFTNNIEINSKNNYFGKTKPQIKKIYEEKLIYSCKRGE